MDRKQRYGCGQHDLICELLNVSNDPSDPGDTAFEAVVRLQLELTEARQRLDAAEALLLRWHSEADTGHLDGVDVELMCATDDYVITHIEAAKGAG